MTVRDAASKRLPALRRRLNLPLLVLYGTGITIGAGIYVLIGAVAKHAGGAAPWSFVLAALVMALTVASYAELATRYPVSAGEAAYVRAAFNSRLASTVTGLLTIVIGVVSSATVTLGAAGYIEQLAALPHTVIIVTVIVVLAAVAAWGILESVLLASLFTLIEAGALIAIIVAGLHAGVPIESTFVLPRPAQFSGIAFASLLAFFAFIGFEDLANVVEEVRVPHRDIPRAMALTLVITTVLYLAVAAIAVSAVAPERLAASPAPLSLIFRELAGVNPATISLIAIVATLNTILAQMSRRHGSSTAWRGRAICRALPAMCIGARRRRLSPRRSSRPSRFCWRCCFLWSGWRNGPRWRRSSSSPWSIRRCCAPGGGASM